MPAVVFLVSKPCRRPGCFGSRFFLLQRLHRAREAQDLGSKPRGALDNVTGLPRKELDEQHVARLSERRVGPRCIEELEVKMPSWVDRRIHTQRRGSTVPTMSILRNTSIMLSATVQCGKLVSRP